MVLGQDVLRQRADLLARVGYVPEHPTVYRWMTVKQALSFCSAVQPKWHEPTAQELLGMFRLDPKQRVRSLSKGMTTKLHLLLALAHRPEVLILDEPLSGLDPIVREDFVDGVLANLCEHECTVLFSSHHVDDVMDVASNAVSLEELFKDLIRGQEASP
jgi:ABC-2 type transport system ATP-binding protein